MGLQTQHLITSAFLWHECYSDPSDDANSRITRILRVWRKITGVSDANFTLEVSLNKLNTQSHNIVPSLILSRRL